MARRTRPPLALLLAALVLALAAAPPAVAQYFGRNKVQYNTFDFRVLQTEHFDIHFYPEAEEGVRDAARMAERWYARLSSLLNHRFDRRMPLILYANDADFRQTNAVGGQIGEGVQGVTEGFKLRVVMPLTGSYADTDHVLGHELVHQFQFDISQRSGQFVNFIRLPLWFIEGMAEYLALGRQDSHTAMWLRDAAIRGAFPTLDQLSRDPRLFPYRYGQGFWAWVGGTFGDEVVNQLFRAALAMPLDSAIVSVTGLRPDSLSARWRRDVEQAYLPLMAGRQTPPFISRDFPAVDPARLDSLGLVPIPGRRVLARDIDAGNINVAPTLSPDGRYVAFLSERDLFGIDLFLADAQTGEVLKRLQSVGSDPHLDAIRFIDSAGTWSPDGQFFAFVTFVRGRNEIAILDVARREIVRRIQVSGVGAIKDPAWSPDGQQIAFMGLAGGIADLYVVDVEGGTARQLTADRHLVIQPTWSPDGRRIAFATDRGPRTDFDRLVYGPPQLALYDFDTNEVTLLPGFGDVKHINPQFSPDGESLYFVSDRGGIPNVYRLHLPTGEAFQVTNLATGVSGITAKAPSLTVAAQTGDLMFSVFEAQAYVVYALPAAEAQGIPIRPPLAETAPRIEPPSGPLVPVPTPTDTLTVEPLTETPERATEPTAPDSLGMTADPPATDARAAADTLRVPPDVPVTLPAGTPETRTTPRAALAAADDEDAGRLGVLPPAQAAPRSRVERYLASADLGLPSPDTDFPVRPYRARLGLDFITQPTVGVGYDSYLGGVGVGGGIAFRFSDMLGDHVLGVVVQANGTLKDIGGAVSYLNLRRRLNWGVTAQHVPILQIGIGADPTGRFLTRYYQRTYVTQAGGIAAFPLSQTRRLEATAAVTRYAQEIEVDVFDSAGRFRRLPLQRVVPEFEPPPALYLAQAGGAYVGDFSFFGFTSPVRGGRFRVGVDGTAGSFTFATVTADYRRYFFARPFLTLAVRGLHLGRYGPDADELFPQFLGFGPLVRGYSFGSFESEAGYLATAPKLFGTRMAVGNVELRLPLIGIRDFGLLTFPFLPTELALFADAGIAWGEFGNGRLFSSASNLGTTGRPLAEQEPIFSAGVSTRFNLLGALVLEVYWARPFSREDGRTSIWGLNFVPGW